MHRIGIGHDTHRLAPGGPLRLGGIDISGELSAVGHSDADALLHALTDALLGAAALGDIGEMFPDTDPANRGRDSGQMLTQAWQAVANAGYKIVNLDCIVHLGTPQVVAPQTGHPPADRRTAGHSAGGGRPQGQDRRDRRPGRPRRSCHDPVRRAIGKKLPEKPSSLHLPRITAAKHLRCSPPKKPRPRRRTASRP